MTIFVRMLADFVRKEKAEAEFEVPEGMVLVPRATLADYLSEYDNHPCPDPVLKQNYRRMLADCLKK